MRITNISESVIEFDDGTTIVASHEQDCCERVYAQFSALKDSPIMDMEISHIEIELVKGSGFKLNGYFVPCYNEQNGYYSSNLKLKIIYNKTHMDIYDLALLECIKNIIY